MSEPSAIGRLAPAEGETDPVGDDHEASLAGGPDAGRRPAGVDRLGDDLEEAEAVGPPGQAVDLRAPADSLAERPRERSDPRDWGDLLERGEVWGIGRTAGVGRRAGVCRAACGWSPASGGSSAAPPATPAATPAAPADRRLRLRHRRRTGSRSSAIRRVRKRSPGQPARGLRRRTARPPCWRPSTACSRLVAANPPHGPAAGEGRARHASDDDPGDARATPITARTR